MTAHDTTPSSVAPSPADTTRWVVPVLGVVAVMAAVVALVAGPAATLSQSGTGLATALLQCVVLAPLALFAARHREGAGRMLLLAAGFLMISFTVHLLPRIGPLADLDWNWQGKTFELVWLTVLLAVLARWAREDVGVRLPVPGSLRPALVVIAVVFTVQALLVVLTVVSGDDAFDGFHTPERLLFDLTHANLVEELLWRGVLIALLDRALGTPWRFFGAKVGWGLVLTTLSFGLGHGLLVTAEGFVFAPDQIILTGLLGLMMGWVRARTGSVWLAYLAHCAPEVAIHAGVGIGALLT